MTSAPSLLGPPRVFAIVLNWNGLEDTLRCVESLGRTSYQPLTVLVVDNGSRVSPRERLTAAGAAVELIENPRNLGYAGGNNVGIRIALERGADFVWILNNDALVEPETLSRLIDTASDIRPRPPWGARCCAPTGPRRCGWRGGGSRGSRA